ncbi:Uncharacterized conserved protein [Phaffia rhodozyma]|uniref:Uncharacterized conserved protein n=1 Tax=Phaffia rhodozyma TaxID=264483 RepID=A0A0F7SU80_PHARH|nr:Uncharacterized conserved protein [Phaffia rhodozyma]
MAKKKTSNNKHKNKMAKVAGATAAVDATATTTDETSAVVEDSVVEESEVIAEAQPETIETVQVETVQSTEEVVSQPAAVESVPEVIAVEEPLGAPIESTPTAEELESIIDEHKQASSVQVSEVQPEVPTEPVVVQESAVVMEAIPVDASLARELEAIVDDHKVGSASVSVSDVVPETESSAVTSEEPVEESVAFALNSVVDDHKEKSASVVSVNEVSNQDQEETSIAAVDEEPVEESVALALNSIVDDHKGKSSSIVSVNEVAVDDREESSAVVNEEPVDASVALALNTVVDDHKGKAPSVVSVTEVSNEEPEQDTAAVDPSTALALNTIVDDHKQKNVASTVSVNEVPAEEEQQQRENETTEPLDVSVALALNTVVDDHKGKATSTVAVEEVSNEEQEETSTVAPEEPVEESVALALNSVVDDHKEKSASVVSVNEVVETEETKEVVETPVEPVFAQELEAIVDSHKEASTVSVAEVAAEIVAEVVAEKKQDEVVAPVSAREVVHDEPITTAAVAEPVDAAPAAEDISFEEVKAEDVNEAESDMKKDWVDLALNRELEAIVDSEKENKADVQVQEVAPEEQSAPIPVITNNLASVEAENVNRSIEESEVATPVVSETVINQVATEEEAFVAAPTATAADEEEAVKVTSSDTVKNDELVNPAEGVMDGKVTESQEEDVVVSKKNKINATNRDTHVPLDLGLGAPIEHASQISKPPSVVTNHEWNLKNLSWPDPRVRGIRRDVKIICQNINGPCSLISLCNVLILRGSIHIDPSKSTVDYDYLSSLIGDFLVERPQSSSTLSLESALSILPTTVHGLSVNPSFKAVGSFSRENDAGELALFELCGVRLTHGWVVDPENAREIEILGQVDTYDAAQTLLVEGSIAQSELSQGGKNSEELEKKIQEAAVVKEFLNNTQTQLTVSGLFGLSESLSSGEIVALFRNSHLSVLYKRPASATDPNEPLLYSLVTDDSFKNEPEIVWESLEDVQGTSTGYVNSEFRPSSAAGGDVAGLSAEAAYRINQGQEDGTDDYDQQLARQLQSEEDEASARQFIDRPSSNQASAVALDTTRAPAPTTAPEVGEAPTVEASQKASSGKEKKDKEKPKGKKCIIM